MCHATGQRSSPRRGRATVQEALHARDRRARQSAARSKRHRRSIAAAAVHSRRLDVQGRLVQHAVCQQRRRARAGCSHWDLAGSKRRSQGAYGQAWTAGVLLGRGPGEDGDFYVGHVYRLQDEGDEVRRAIKATAEIDGKGVVISLPQDPGQAGKVQARDMVKMLAGWRVKIQKELRQQGSPRRAVPVAVRARQCQDHHDWRQCEGRVGEAIRRRATGVP